MRLHRNLNNWGGLKNNEKSKYVCTYKTTLPLNLFKIHITSQISFCYSYSTFGNYNVKDKGCG